MIDKNTMGGRLRELRDGAGYSLRGLGYLCGVSAQHLADVEHGRRGLSEETLEKVAKMLGVGSGELRAMEPISKRAVDAIKAGKVHNAELARLLESVSK